MSLLQNAAEHQSNKVVKMLLLGDSGSGKTGALASLVKDYKVTVLDFDNGLDYLVRLVKKDDPKNLSNLSYVTLTDEMQTKGERIMPKGKPRAYADCLKAMDELKLSEWDSSRILVLDSLTFFCNAVLNYYRFLNGTLASGRTDIRDYGQAMAASENFLATVQSQQSNFHYIVITHLQYLEVGNDNPTPVSRGLKPAATDVEQQFWKAFPSALGKKLPPTVATYFNTSLLCTRNNAKKRVIRTDSKGIVDLKSGLPGCPNELSLETGLSDYFKLALG